MANPYLETRIRTASPLDLVVQMYDGVLRQIEIARGHFEAGRVRERTQAISRALAIVNELRSSLDFERGAEVARNLEALYVYAGDRLLEANLRNECAALDAAATALAPLRDAWRELAARPIDPADPT